MTDTKTPIEATFELQRQSIKQGQQFFEHGLELQENTAERMMKNGFAAQHSLQRQGTELARQLFDAQLEAMESALDEAQYDVRSTIDDQVEVNAKQTQKLLTEQYDQGVDLLKQMIHAQFDALESAMDRDGADIRSTVDEQFEEFERTQDRTWAEFEAAVVESVEELTDQQQTVLTESIESILEAHKETEQQALEGVRRAEETAGTVQQSAESAMQTSQKQGEAMLETGQAQTQGLAGDAADATVSETTTAIESAAEGKADEHTLQHIDGVGQTYAKRLAEAGIETVEDLATTDTEAVADAAAISEDRASDWIQAAQSQA